MENMLKMVKLNSGITFVYSYADGGTDTGLLDFKPVFNSYELTKDNFYYLVILHI